MSEYFKFWKSSANIRTSEYPSRPYFQHCTNNFQLKTFLATRFAMADSASEAGGYGSGVSDFEDDGEPGFDPSQIENMSEKEKKKWEKNLQSWRIFMDFLVRHIAIATFKYNCFELDDLPQFMIAMEKADAIRATTKLKKGEEKHITSFKTMKESSELLVQHQYILESNRIKKFLDIAGRMRGLTMIAGGFYKALKKGKVKGLDKIKYYLDYWKGFTVRTYNYSELNFRNANPETFSELEQKYKVWPTVVRTALNLAQKFLKKASDGTGLDMLPKDLKIQQKHMQTAELVVATKIEDMMLQKFNQEASSFTIGMFTSYIRSIGPQRI